MGIEQSKGIDIGINYERDYLISSVKLILTIKIYLENKKFTISFATLIFVASSAPRNPGTEFHSIR